MAWPRIPGVWRMETEMLCGSETFKNDIDIMEVGYVSGDDDPPALTDDICAAVLEFFTTIFYSDVTVVGAKLRNIYYHRDPAHPEEHPPIHETIINTAGDGVSTWGGAHNANYLPADVAIYIRKACSGGRNGKMFVRNILTEVDVSSGLGGLWSFSSGSGHFQESVMASVISSTLAPFFLGGSDTGTWDFAVTHLENIALDDTRTPYPSAVTGMTALRPVWNRAHR